MFTSLPVEDTGRKNTEPVNPNSYLVHDNSESLHLDMYREKSYTHRELYMPLQIRQLPRTTLSLFGLLPQGFLLSTAFLLPFLPFTLSGFPLSLSWRFCCPPRLLFLCSCDFSHHRRPPPLPFRLPSQHHPPHGRLRPPYNRYHLH